MAIRRATEADLPGLVALGRAMHAEAPRMRLHAFDGEKVGKVLSFALSSGVIFVYEGPDGVIEGGFAGILTERWFSPDREFRDLAMFVRQDKRGGLAAWRLLRAVIAWCQEQGLQPSDVQFGISTGVHLEQTGRLYEALGFRRVGHIYELEAF